MAYRTFIDSTGTEWQAWDIVPRLNERRSAEETDRRFDEVAVAFRDRRRDSRRLTQVRRAVLSGTYARGWLCFESEAKKRRLSPIPPDWTTCSEKLLERYAGYAEPVRGERRTLSIQGDEPLAKAG